MTTLLVALLLGAATPPPTPTAVIATFVIVETDGSVVRLQKAPALKGSSYVGRLWPSGQLVSIPAAKVDERRTAAANAGGRTAAPPAETEIGTRYKPAGPQAPLGDTMTLKGGRRTVERTLQGTPTHDAETGASGRGERRDAPAASATVDRNGRGEAWWRGRAAPLEEKLADAEAELKLASDERKLFEGTAPAGGEDVSLERRRLVAREEQARQHVAAAKRQLEELAAEARDAGAPASWVR
jgi:hypothetical protein